MSHVCTLMVIRAAGIAARDIVHYRGTGPALIDLMSGQTDFMCIEATGADAQIAAGRLKRLGQPPVVVTGRAARDRSARWRPTWVQGDRAAAAHVGRGYFTTSAVESGERRPNWSTHANATVSPGAGAVSPSGSVPHLPGDA